MKYSEAKKQIEALSSKYSVERLWGYFGVNYKGTEIACVGSNERYVHDIRNKHYFQELPFSNKLYMILSELAMTPLDKRVDKRKYLVKAFGKYLSIQLNDSRPSINTSYESSGMRTKFTLKEIKQLKQRNDIPLDWNKVELETIDED